MALNDDKPAPIDPDKWYDLDLLELAFYGRMGVPENRVTTEDWDNFCNTWLEYLIDRTWSTEADLIQAENNSLAAANIDIVIVDVQIGEEGYEEETLWRLKQK